MKKQLQKFPYDFDVIDNKEEKRSTKILFSPYNNLLTESPAA